MTFSHYLWVGAKAADRIALVMCCLLLSAMVVLIGAQVVARYLIGSTLPWTEEVARHLMIWMLFIGIAPAYRRGAHLGVDFMPDRLSNRVRAVVLIFVVSVMALFCT